MMRIKLNGGQRDMSDGASVNQLLQQLNLTPQRVAIELNRRLLRGEKYDTPLQEGDEIEIVTFVGGG